MSFFCGTTARPDVVYSVPVSEPKPNETAIYRSVAAKKSLLATPEDGVNTCYDCFQHGLKVNPKGNCLGKRVIGQDGEPGEFEWQSYEEIFATAKAFGSGLINKGCVPLIKHPDEKYRQDWQFVGLFSKNRPEWVITEQACNCYSLTLVPVYDTLGPDTLEFVLNHTKLTTVVCSRETARNLAKVSPSCPELKNCVVFDAPSEEDRSLFKDTGVTLLSMEEVTEAGKASPVELKPPTPDDVNTFCYTSGTTGNPKGAMITHRQLVAVCASAMNHESIKLQADDVLLSYLPAAHIFERIVNQATFFAGGSTGFYRGDTLKLVEDVQALKPTLFVSVPRLFNRIYEKIMGRVEGGGGLKKSLFNMALNSKVSNLRADGSLSHGFWDMIVFSKFKTILGGRIRLLLTGSAPISGNVHEQLKVMFGSPFLEGYGMTESCGASCVSNSNDPDCGHVGGPLNSVEIKLVSVPDMEYFADADVPKGEICFRGPTVFPGYFMDPEKTAEALDEDGWLHSGDIGMLRDNGSLKIIDRKKNIFKLAQGEYVAAEKIELAYQQALSVAQIFVFGYSSETYLVGILVPDEDAGKAWAKENNKTYASWAEQVADPDFQAKIKKDMTEAEAKNKLLGFEKVKKIHFSSEPFSVENNLLTPTFKLKRNDAKKAYQKEIDTMYGISA